MDRALPLPPVLQPHPQASGAPLADVTTRRETVDAGHVAVDALDLVAALDLGVVVISPDWRIVFANHAWRALVGAPVHVVGADLDSAMPALAGTSAAALLVRTLADGEPRTFQVDYRDARVDRTFSVRTRRSAAGMLVCVMQDATARSGPATQAVQLAEQHDENEALHALARAMSAVSDSAALLRILCEAAVAQCDAAASTVAQVRDGRGEYAATVGHPADLCGRRFALAGTLTERVLTSRRTLAHPSADVHADPALFPRLLDGSRVGPVLLAPLVAHDVVLGVLAVSRGEHAEPFSARDEQRLSVIADHAALALWKSQLFEAAQAASHTKSNFLATISHELRTPLTALTGYGELLADEILGPMAPAQHDVVERMRSVTHHLTAMIEEILTFSSLEAGREHVRLVPATVDDVVQGAIKAVLPLAQAKDIPLHAHVAGDVPTIVTDPEKLRQILVNLVGNAVKFTEHGDVRVTVSSVRAADATRAPSVRFAVRDTGIGISAEDLPKLFHPFAQLDEGLTRRFGGTGLGLYIAQQLAVLLGGTLQVQSELGVGSTFTLTLPVG
jgi:signal transduction histidine kinase